MTTMLSFPCFIRGVETISKRHEYDKLSNHEHRVRRDAALEMIGM
jgi:hypothetical protein